MTLSYHFLNRPYLYHYQSSHAAHSRSTDNPGPDECGVRVSAGARAAAASRQQTEAAEAPAQSRSERATVLDKAGELGTGHHPERRTGHR